MNASIAHRITRSAISFSFVRCILLCVAPRLCDLRVYRTSLPRNNLNAVQEFLDRTIRKNNARPKYIVTDKGSQFWCDPFKAWCKARDVKPRFGAAGKRGSIAVAERFIRTLKDEYARSVDVPLRRRDFRAGLARFLEWYNDCRPHTFLHGRTPNEVYHRRHPACRYPRFEPRSRWPRASPCAAPRVPIRGKSGVRLALDVTCHAGQTHLPIIKLRLAA